MTKSINDGETDRERFFQGASWAARQCVQSCDKGTAGMAKLRDQYNDRIRACDDDHFMRLRAAEWLIDSCQRLTKEVRDDNQEVLEKAIRDQASATQLLKHI